MTNHIANATNLTGALQFLNTGSDGLIGLAVIFVPAIVLFGATVRFGEEKAGLAASFLLLFNTLIMWRLALINGSIGIVLTVVFSIMLVVLFLTSRWSSA